jgi:hypothetical protein
MKFWWCNQGKCWKAERKAGVVCGCTYDVRRWTHRRTVGDVVAGDLTLHYVRKKIVAVSVAKSNGQKYEKLEEVKPNPYGRGFGWRFEADYFDFKPAIPKEAFIEALLALRPEAKGNHFPVNRNGSIHQGYFLHFSEMGLKAVRASFETDWPSWAG